MIVLQSLLQSHIALLVISTYGLWTTCSCITSCWSYVFFSWKDHGTWDVGVDCVCHFIGTTLVPFRWVSFHATAKNGGNPAPLKRCIQKGWMYTVYRVPINWCRISAMKSKYVCIFGIFAQGMRNMCVVKMQLHCRPTRIERIAGTLTDRTQMIKLIETWKV